VNIHECSLGSFWDLVCGTVWSIISGREGGGCGVRGFERGVCVFACLLTCLAVPCVECGLGVVGIIGSYRACFTCRVVRVCCLVLPIADVLMISWEI